MTDLQVSVDELLDARQFVAGVADDFHSKMDRLTKFVDELLGGSWTGSAATDYTEPWGEWKDGGNRVIAALHDSAELLGQTAANYADQEAANARAMGAVTPQIGHNSGSLDIRAATSRWIAKY